MSSIDLAILGIVMERPQSAYDIQRDVDAHHFPRWTKISTASVYRRVLRLEEEGYLEGTVVPGERFADKTVYAVTEAGRRYFQELMEAYAAQPVPLRFDFNVVVANLNKLPLPEALPLLDSLEQTLRADAQATADYAAQYADIPLTGRTIFQQQGKVYEALLAWLEAFRQEVREHGREEQSDGSL